MSDNDKQNDNPIPLTAMTLRDHFAACALTGILAMHADPECNAPNPDALVREAYEIADAMIAARGKGEG